MNHIELEPITNPASTHRLPAWGLNHAHPPLGNSAKASVEIWCDPAEPQACSSNQFFGGISPEAVGGQPDSFEALLLGVLPILTGLPVRKAELEMELALQRICKLLGLQWAAVWHKSLETPDSLAPAHCLFANICREKCSSPAIGNDDGWFESAWSAVQIQGTYPWISSEALRAKPIVFSRLAELPAEASADQASLSSLGVSSGIIIPLCLGGEVLGAISLGMLTEQRHWPDQLIRRLEGLAAVFAQAAARQRSEERLLSSEAQLNKAVGEIKQLKERLQAETEQFESQIKLTHSHDQIIGRSRQIMNVLRQSEQVASAGCSVLITGETGTGKELIAQEIHRLSPRKDRPMVLVNCAALPAALVESELFGRERGAYTGALTSQIGRFEAANGSTIFLDEIGELPMDLQAKLLRVLQKGEFQRLGNPKTIKVDVRVIAATNKDLAEEVRRGKFREDLYYRLRVFPITLPPLRDREEDIPLLAFAFIKEFSARMGKKIEKISRKTVQALQAHSWPGNIRELRNVIERSVIMSSGDTLKLTLLSESTVRPTQALTLAEVEREHILKTLESTGWRIKGACGAAARLALQPSTLYSRMLKLAIPHRRQKDNFSTATANT